ncbi:SBBP repeat-containing protein [Verrucomicrobium sp. BvORR034]|uniref:SBBP repeat-containing protein n=1 Tax=Verrucomicrobium sp. BvORR034 TaxID=1396418 RepID=UPI0006791177|nr:SBBP repeat-containing protein [Verrucomicrobium sp. BvORR034]
MTSTPIDLRRHRCARAALSPYPAGLIGFLLWSLVGSLATQVQAAAEAYQLAYSTYLGGAVRWDQARDVCVDAAGNAYVTGGTTSVDFPTTPGAYDRTYNRGGKDIGSGGHCDVFVSKFDPEGKLLWSTYLGGPNYDRGYGIKVDAAGFVYVCGRAGPGFPVTGGAFQPTFRGVDAGIYGMNNGFVAKLKPDGSGLVWASYVGVGSLCRDFDLDAQGNVFTHLAYESAPGTGAQELPAAWFANTFQPTRRGGRDNGVIKIAADGAFVLWATWLGGSEDEQKEACVRVDAEGRPCLLFWTKSADMVTTPGAYDRKYHGGQDAYLVKVSANGRSLEWATYFGGAGDSGGCSTHNLALDAAGNAVISQHTTADDLPVTAGAFQTQYGGGKVDALVARFDAVGNLVASTLLGGVGEEGFDGIGVDRDGRVFVTGQSNSDNFQCTADAFQAMPGGDNDAVLVLLEPDLRRLAYSTRMGGAKWDYGRSGCLGPNGDLYVTGSCSGEGWPIRKAWQASFAGGVGSCYEGGCGAGDVVLARFARWGPPP